MISGFDGKGFEDFQSIGQENLGAAIASVSVWTRGWQAIAAEYADFSKRTFEQSTRAFEDTINARSIDRALEVQAEYAKASYEDFLGEVNKIGEMYMTTARRAFAPNEATATKRA